MFDGYKQYIFKASCFQGVSFKLIHKYSSKNHYELKSDSNGTKYETDNTLT